MASNYTENYGLCQWEATDQVLRTVFNEDNRKVDEALSDLAEARKRLDRTATHMAYYTGRLAAQSIWKNNLSLPSHHILCDLFMSTIGTNFTGGAAVQNQTLVLNGAGKTGSMLTPKWAVQDSDWTQARMWIHFSGGTVTPTLNGSSMELVTTAYTYSIRGVNCFEQEYVWNGTGSTSTQINLTLETGNADSLTVYDYYLVLF